MAGHGPPPKDPALRQRRNKAATRAIVEGGGPAPLARVSAHDLPVRPCSFCPEDVPAPPKRKKGKRASPRKPPEVCKVCFGASVMPWHRWTLEWWAAVWNPDVNPFCFQYLETEVLGSLRALANLYDMFWHGVDRGKVDLDVERAIRLRERALVLDPLARRAAQWEVKRPPAQRPPLAPPVGEGGGARPVHDPRKVLFMEGAGGNRA